MSKGEWKRSNFHIQNKIKSIETRHNTPRFRYTLHAGDNGKKTIAIAQNDTKNRMRQRQLSKKKLSKPNDDDNNNSKKSVCFRATFPLFRNKVDQVHHHHTKCSIYRRGITKNVCHWFCIVSTHYYTQWLVCSPGSFTLPFLTDSLLVSLSPYQLLKILATIFIFATSSFTPFNLAHTYTNARTVDVRIVKVEFACRVLWHAMPQWMCDSSSSSSNNNKNHLTLPPPLPPLLSPKNIQLFGTDVDIWLDFMIVCVGCRCRCARTCHIVVFTIFRWFFFLEFSSTFIFIFAIVCWPIFSLARSFACRLACSLAHALVTF